MRNPIVRWGVGVAISLLVGGAWVFHAMQAFEIEQRNWMYRMTRAVLSAVSSDAAVLQDDLLIQKTVQELSLQNGVKAVMVVDTDNRIRVHSDPAQVGSMLPKLRDAWRIPVTDALDTPETWVLQLAQPSWKSRFNQWLIAFSTFLVSIGISFIGFLGASFAAFQRERSLRRDSQVSATSVQKKIEEESQLHQQREKRLKGWLDAVLSQFPKPAIVLDSTQRILLVHPAVLARLPGGSISLPVGSSWNELPWFGGFGETLAQSLEKPGACFETSLSPLASHAIVVTEALPDGSEVLTWIYLT